MEKINHKAIKVFFNCDESYDDLPTLNKKGSLHQKHLRLWATEILKFMNNLTPKFMKSSLNSENITYNLCKFTPPSC